MKKAIAIVGLAVVALGLANVAGAQQVWPPTRSNPPIYSQENWIAARSMRIGNLTLLPYANPWQANWAIWSPPRNAYWG